VPTYQYVCTDCGEDLEVVQKFSDAALTTHEACGGKLRKIFSPVGIVFKGSGFYRTDSRGSSSVTSSSAEGSSGKSDKSEKSASGGSGGSESSSSSGSGSGSDSSASSGSSTSSSSTSKTDSKSSSATKVA
jgi:putative FmdB family regulatory protein